MKKILRLAFKGSVLVEYDSHEWDDVEANHDCVVVKKNKETILYAPKENLLFWRVEQVN